jgi:hypothetical protein
VASGKLRRRRPVEKIIEVLRKVEEVKSEKI